MFPDIMAKKSVMSSSPPTPTPHDLFKTYARMWAFSEFVVNYGTVFLSPGCGAFHFLECAATPWWFYIQVVLWLAVLVKPTRATLIPSMLVRVAQYRVQSPMIWESCHWADATELAFVAVLLLCPLDSAVAASADLIRTMMGLFYVGAGFCIRTEARTHDLRRGADASPVLSDPRLIARR